MRILMWILLGITPALVHAQEVQINEDPTVSKMMQSWTSGNRANARIAGWRVQILSSTDRQKIEEIKTQFSQAYPEVPAEWVHQKPYYKLRAGAFRSRLEAMAFIENLKDTYPGAYPAQDPAIHPRDFLE